jgi:antitoxin HigA-1
MRMTQLLPNPHPGEILAEEFWKPMELSQTTLARAIGVPPRRINEMVLASGPSRQMPDSRLARYFKITQPEPPESSPSCAFPCGSS